MAITPYSYRVPPPQQGGPPRFSRCPLLLYGQNNRLKGRAILWVRNLTPYSSAINVRLPVKPYYSMAGGLDR